MCEIGRISFRVVICGVFVLAMSAISLHAQNAVETDGIVYRKAGSRELMLDIAMPLPQGVARPAVIFLCGNGWGYSKNMNREGFSYALDIATAKGYVGITVEYSSFQESSNCRPIGTFPAQVHDVKSATRFLRANAKQYDIDIDHIGVIGESSGGNLGLLVGLTLPSDGLEGADDYAQYSSGVQAVVNFAGPTDLMNMKVANIDPYKGYLGGTLEAQPEQYERASPITYVRPGGPPVLTIHGDMDNEVSIDQAVRLHKKMKEVGATHTLIIKKGRGHYDFVLDDVAVGEFLGKTLKN